MPAGLSRTVIGVLALLVATSSWGQPRHVILIIGDGMDDHQVTIARNYLRGAGGTLGLDLLPLRSAVQVMSVTDSSDPRPVYVADSANTATAIATGIVTNTGRIATYPGSGRPATTIVQLAQRAGYATGLVTTASVTDGTPAAFASHMSQRYCENPERMRDFKIQGVPMPECPDFLQANQGPGSISEQLAVSGVDVILGGGAMHFAPPVENGSQSVLELARQSGFRTLTSAAELASVRSGERLLGVFSQGHMPVRWRAEDDRTAERPQPSLLHRLHSYLGEVTPPVPMRCEPNPAYGDTPPLATMTRVALAQLSAASQKGFFLMVESASIDKQAHRRKPCGGIGEVEQLEEALAEAVAFAQMFPETLILVTADHGHSAQIFPEESLYARSPIPIYTPGYLARVITPEGSILAVNYASTNFVQEEHSGANVPLYSNRPDLVPPFMRQPEIFALMRDFLGLQQQDAAVSSAIKNARP